ncbi:unnamed protein product [Symbiodinium sp. CCMP2592]|nr:unnamed protein product [Symbiodinium sp. CCMP2592]
MSPAEHKFKLRVGQRRQKLCLQGGCVELSEITGRSIVNERLQGKRNVPRRLQKKLRLEELLEKLMPLQAFRWLWGVRSDDEETLRQLRQESAELNFMLGLACWSSLVAPPSALHLSVPVAILFLLVFSDKLITVLLHYVILPLSFAGLLSCWATSTFASSVTSLAAVVVIVGRLRLCGDLPLLLLFFFFLFLVDLCGVIFLDVLFVTLYFWGVFLELRWTISRLNRMIWRRCKLSQVVHVVRPVPDSDEDEDSPSKRPQIGEEKPLTARELRELLFGHVHEMKSAWHSFQGRLENVEREQGKTTFEVCNLQARTRVLEKDLGQQRQTSTAHATALESLTADVKNLRVKLDDLSARGSPAVAGSGPPGDAAPAGDPWAEYLRHHPSGRPAPAGNDGKDGGARASGSSADDRGDALSEDDKRTLVVGGWLQDTKRSIIEEESAAILNLPEVKNLVDSEKLLIFGPRRSVGMLRFSVRDGEDFQGMKTRMWELVRALGRIKHILPSTKASGEEKTMWASFVKTKNARLRSSHVSLTRRVVISLTKDGGHPNGPNTLIGAYDCDWNMGTIWNGCEKLASSTHRKPAKTEDEFVVMSGGWINVSAVARVAGCSTDDARGAFERELKLLVMILGGTAMTAMSFTGLFIVTLVSGGAAAQEFAKLCPRKYRHLPVVCGVDANEVPHWDLGEDGQLAIGTCSSNLNVLIHGQIDMMFSRHIHIQPLMFEPDRRHLIGTDHAIVLGGLPDIEIVDEDDLIEIASKCTKPRRSQRYRDSDEVKNAIVAARSSMLPADWKRVHRLRKQERRHWSQARLAKILNGDWDQYRTLQNEKKRRRGWWGDLLEANGSSELAQKITSHLEEKMLHPSKTSAEWEEELHDLIGSAAEDDLFVPFTLLDVRTELQGMKCRSAVGPDGIGVHLLREIASHDLLGPRLLNLVNFIVESRQLPHSWEKSFLALLAKCKVPKDVGDLRPICVSSAFHKLVNRLVCARALPIMRRGSKISCCGKGRQAADLIGAISRLRDITKEWRHPLILCKLDVAGAFDKIDRRKVAELLLARLKNRGVSFELRYLLAQLATHQLVGQAPGGQIVSLRPDNGIKQGAPESAELFGLVVDSILSELVFCKRWGDLGQPIEGLDIDLLFYQDDVFLVETQFARLCRRIGIVDRCFRQAGLTLAKSKTKIVANDHYLGARRAKVGDDLFVIAPRGESLKVLGIAFSLSHDASEQAKELISRTRDAAAAHKDILNAPGPWLHKVNIMKTLLESQFAWTGGAIHWSKDDLHCMNVLQLHTCRSAFGLRRAPGENWVQWNQRSLRFVRAWLHRQGVHRWSARVLTLQHTLHGHWARRTEVVRGSARACAPMRAVMWRNTYWWREQQALDRASSLRHPQQFYASNVERQLAQSNGNLWYVAAQDRQTWAAERVKYIEEWDVRWCNGRQLSLRM